MHVEVDTVLNLATRRRYVLGAVSVHHMIEQEVWLEPAMASFNMWKPGRRFFAKHTGEWMGCNIQGDKILIWEKTFQ